METFAVFLSLLGLCFSAKLPLDFPVCKGSENIKECLKSAVENSYHILANGIPDLKVPTLDPLYIPSVTIGEGTGPVNVVQNYKDFKVYGLSNLHVQKAESSVSSAGFEMDIEMFYPSVRFEADYNFNGRVLLLPLVGSGKCKITLKELTITLKMVSETFEKKGKSYFRVKDVTVDHKPKKVEFEFQNLFNGDERLGAEMHKLLNDNWKEVFDDAKVGYNKALTTVYKDYANKIFTKIPTKALL